MIIQLPMIFAQGSDKMLDFSGSSQMVNCGTINLSGTALSLQGWVKVDAFKTGHPYISSLWGTESAGAQAMVRFGDAGISANQAQFVIYNGSTHHKLNGQKTLNTGQWYHVAATYDGSTMRLYINGVLDVSMSVSTSIVSNSTFQIGQHYAASRTIDGQIDEVSVFRAALSQTTIRDWMCRSISSSHPNYSNLEGYWKLDNGTGTSATDHSGNGHGGTLTGSPAWQTSSAPIGDVSVSAFSSPYNLGLAHAVGDSMSLSGVSGSPSSAHLYLINEKPNLTTLPSGITEMDTTRYWGVWYAEGNNPRGNVSYQYTANSHYQNNGSCMIDMVKRAHNAAASWAAISASQSSSALSKSTQTAGEFALVYRSNKRIHNDTNKRICMGDSVSLVHGTSGLYYSWYRNGSLISGASTNTYVARQDGLYQLIIGLASCNDTSNTFRLGTDTIPTVSFAPLPASCSDVFLDTISGGSPAGGIYLNNWMSGTLFVVQNAGPGNHKIVYRYRDANGCVDTASQIKRVLNPPSINLSSQADVCEDASAFNFNLTSLTGGQYFINGAAGNNFDPQISGPGMYSVRYDYTDTNSCSGSDSVSFQVNALPQVSVSFVNDEHCEYDTNFVMIGFSPSGGVFTGTGTNLGQFYPQVAGAGVHIINYSYTDTSTTCSNAANDAMIVHARPSLPVISELNDTLSSTLALTYQWYEDSLIIPGATNQSYAPDTNGFFQVKVTDEHCESLISASFEYEKEVILDPGGFGDHFANSLLKIYPNPNNGSFVLENLSSQNGSLALYDLRGKLVASFETESKLTKVDLNLEKGLYLLVFNGEAMRKLTIR